jgi:hypothetical protein
MGIFPSGNKTYKYTYQIHISSKITPLKRQISAQSCMNNEGNITANECNVEKGRI